MRMFFRILVTAAALSALSACSSGSGDSDDAGVASNEPAIGDNAAAPAQPPANDADLPVLPAPIDLPQGSVTQYASVTVADGKTDKVDFHGNFFKLQSGVSSQFMLERFTSEAATCEVQPDEADLNDLVQVYVPTVSGVEADIVSGGETIIVTSPSGTYATLVQQLVIGTLNFYDTNTELEASTLQPGLTVDIASGGGFPALTAAAVPRVEPLGDVSYGSAETIRSNVQFSWTPSSVSGSLISISSATGDSFFRDPKAVRLKVECLVPDTGSFSFPEEIQTQLGADFNGKKPEITRLAVNAVQVDTTVFYVIRESLGR